MLKSVFCTVCLAFGSLAAHQYSDRPPEGSSLLYSEKDAQIEKNTDGSKMIRTPDGTTIEVRQDGSKTVTKPDGTKIEIPGKNN